MPISAVCSAVTQLFGVASPATNGTSSSRAISVGAEVRRYRIPCPLTSSDVEYVKMTRITYHEFRPGRWVRLVDGEVVGTATRDEVEAWQRSLDAQDDIWMDVVRRAAPATPAHGDQADLPRTSLSPDSAARSASGPRPADRPSPLESPPSRASTAKPPVRPSVDVVEIPGLTGPAGLPVASSRPTAARRPDADTVDIPGFEAPAATVRPPVTVTHPTPPSVPTTDDLEIPALSQRSPAAPAAPQASKTPVPQTSPPRPTTATGPTRSVPAVKQNKGADGPGVRQARPASPQRPQAVQRSQPPETPLVPDRSLDAISALVDEVDTSPKVTPALRKPIVRAEPVPAETLADEATGWGEELPEAGLDDDGASVDLDHLTPPRPVRRSVSQRTAPSAGRGPSEGPEPGPEYVWVVAPSGDNLADVVRSWLPKYQERYSQPAAVLMCHEQDLAALQGAGLPLEVRQGRNIPPQQFWIGHK